MRVDEAQTGPPQRAGGRGTKNLFFAAQPKTPGSAAGAVGLLQHTARSTPPSHTRSIRIEPARPPPHRPIPLAPLATHSASSLAPRPRSGPRPPAAALRSTPPSRPRPWLQRLSGPPSAPITGRRCLSPAAGELVLKNGVSRPGQGTFSLSQTRSQRSHRPSNPLRHPRGWQHRHHSQHVQHSQHHWQKPAGLSRGPTVMTFEFGMAKKN